MNLVRDLPHNLQEEVFETLIRTKDMRLERIVTPPEKRSGTAGDEQHWYDQDQHEWVTILSGWARLAFAADDDVLLRPGDHLLIPAHKIHRVAETDPTQETIWLALHYTVHQADPASPDAFQPST